MSGQGSPPVTLHCILDGTEIADIGGAYSALAAGLGFPAGFRGNLDALWDVLTVDLAGPVHVIWRHADRSRQRLGADFHKVREVLDAAAGARDDFRVTYE